MEISAWVPYATFITLVVGLIGLVLSKLYCAWRKIGNRAVVKNQDEGRLSKVDAFGDDIHSLQVSCESINRNVDEINKYGSGGARKEFKEINRKLDNHRQRLIRIEAHVNGGLETVPPDEVPSEVNSG